MSGIQVSNRSISLFELLSDRTSVLMSTCWAGFQPEGSQIGGKNASGKPQLIQRSESAPTASEHEKKSASESKPEETNAKRRDGVQVVTWNIAAPNTNPFEYWAMHTSEDYNDMMASVQHFIDHPEAHDQKICHVFTDEMYAELRQELSRQEVKNLESLDRYWTSDLKNRWAIREFLKDPSFGEKRLISMPDRITGSMKKSNGDIIFRPSPITGIQADMSNVRMWWPLWTTYMFRTELNVRGQCKKNAFALLQTISRAKYPALAEAEEALSLPLQTLCLALFDSIYIHVLSTVAPKTWQPLKRSLHAALFEHKAARCVSILQTQYGDADVIFIQEASEAFASRAGVCLDHFVLRPSAVDGRRSQLSLILARKSLFLRHTARDLTEEVLRRLPSKCTTAGDLCVFELASHEGPYLLASFHGDSDGACTAPVLSALHGLARERFPDHTLLFGLDANTAAGPAGGQGDGDSHRTPERRPPHFHAGSAAETGESAAAHVAPCGCDRDGEIATAAAGRGGIGTAGLDGGGFCALLGERGLGSCWDGQDLRGLWTTFNARTYLQPQLHKAVGLEGVLDRRHMRLRDWVVFRAGQLAVAGVERDNTGRRGCFLPRAMPSEGFPSDHAIVAAVLRRPGPMSCAVAECAPPLGSAD